VTLCLRAIKKALQPARTCRRHDQLKIESYWDLRFKQLSGFQNLTENGGYLTSAPGVQRSCYPTKHHAMQPVVSFIFQACISQYVWLKWGKYRKHDSQDYIQTGSLSFPCLMVPAHLKRNWNTTVSKQFRFSQKETLQPWNVLAVLASQSRYPLFARQASGWTW